MSDLWRVLTGRAAERGSSMPFILLCFLLVLLVVAGTTATSSAFLSRRDLQADCDGAALAAINGLDTSGVFGRGSLPSIIPVAQAAAERAVGRYAAGLPSGPATGFAVGVGTPDGADLSAITVTVRCSRTVPVALGGLVAVPEGVELTVDSTAEAPVRG